MKIEHIEISNVLGIKEASITPATPALIVCGPNGAGKSSVLESIRMAMDGVSPRIALKKNYSALVHGDAKVGRIGITVDGEIHSIGLPAAKGHKPIQNEFLPYVLDPARFAAEAPSTRRAMLFELMGVRIKPDDIRARLTQRGHDEKRIAEIMPYVRAGFDDAMGEAKNRATEQKGAWKQITGGETYGAVKAEGWAASKPASIDQAKLDEARADLARIDAEIESESSKLGEQKAIKREIDGLHEEIVGLKRAAGMRDRIADKLERDRAELKETEARVESMREQAGTKPRNTVDPLPCPHCGGMLALHQGRLEQWHEEARPQYDAEAAAALPQHEQALELMRKSVANGERDLKAAEAAQATIAAFEQRIQEAPDLLDIDALNERINALKHSRTNQASAIRLLEEAQRAAATADEKTEQAAKAHAAVQAWDAIAESLSPAGIRAEMLAEALAPFNATLARNADSAGWFVPRIDDEMNIFTGFGRPYAVTSESERWRMDAIIAASISEHAGLRMMLLDRFDLLDLAGRAGLVAWINGEVNAGRIDSAIIAGTLKTMPSGLPGTFSAVWVEGGEVRVEMREAA